MPGALAVSARPQMGLRTGPVACAAAGAGARATPTSGVIPFLLTDVGEGIAECEVLKWHVREGDAVREFQKLCELQSDKATVEITSRFAGKVLRLHYRPGQMARVGQPLVDIDLGPAAAAAGGAAGAAASASVPPAASPAAAPARTAGVTPTAAKPASSSSSSSSSGGSSSGGAWMLYKKQ